MDALEMTNNLALYQILGCQSISHSKYLLNIWNEMSIIKRTVFELVMNLPPQNSENHRASLMRGVVHPQDRANEQIRTANGNQIIKL